MNATIALKNILRTAGLAALGAFILYRTVKPVMESLKREHFRKMPESEYRARKSRKLRGNCRKCQQSPYQYGRNRLESFRRIAMDYEFYSNTGEAMVQLASCQLMYNKIYE